MAIEFAVESIVSNFFRTVRRFLHAAENRVVNRVLLRQVRRFFNDAFHLEAVLQAAAFNAQPFDKTGQFRELGFTRLRMNTTHQEQLFVSKSLGNGFVGGQHKLFDDLVALGVLDRMRATDFAVVVQVDFDFGQNQVDRSAIHSSST